MLMQTAPRSSAESKHADAIVSANDPAAPLRTFFLVLSVLVGSVFIGAVIGVIWSECVA